MDTPTECELKSDESSVCKNESKTDSLEIIEQNEVSIDVKRKTKRKKSTSTDEVADSNEIIDENEIDYAIIENENKRQKIELVANRKENKENELTVPVGDGLTVEKPLMPSNKAPKDTKCNNDNSKLRLKYENIHTNTVQKLNAQAEQLRMEISTLRTALANEQNAVRVLR